LAQSLPLRVDLLSSGSFRETSHGCCQGVPFPGPTQTHRIRRGIARSPLDQSVGIGMIQRAGVMRRTRSQLPLTMV
jgi:hypothetical protein